MTAEPCVSGLTSTLDKGQHNHPSPVVKSIQLKTFPDYWRIYTPTEVIDFKYKNWFHISYWVNFNTAHSYSFRFKFESNVYIYIMYIYICIPYMSSVIGRLYIYNKSVIQYWRSCTPSGSIGLYFWGVRGSWAECHFLFSLVYHLCLALW